MSEVKIIKKRESILYGGFKPEGAPDFTTVDYVLLSDYEKLKAQLERAEEALKYYITSYYVFDDEDDDTEQLHPDKPWRHISGKRAREYFKEKGKV